MSLLDVFLRRVVLHGSLTVVDHQGNAKTFGTSGSEYPDVTIRLNDSGVAGAIVRNPTLGAGEAYMDGRFSVDDADIMGLLELVQANTRWESRRPLERSGLLQPIGGAVTGNTAPVNQRSCTKANLPNTYDLSYTLY